MTKFSPGQSGNPKGRPKGSKNRGTRLVEALVDDIPELINVTKEKAMNGDMVAMKLLLERAFPTRKAILPPINLPDLDNAETLKDQIMIITKAIRQGEISTDQAQELIKALRESDDLIRIESEREKWSFDF